VLALERHNGVGLEDFRNGMTCRAPTHRTHLCPQLVWELAAKVKCIPISSDLFVRPFLALLVTPS
jgi:hypothetical protein